MDIMTTRPSVPSPDSGAQQAQTKRRAACDECRTKKLKCTGDHPACSRCVRENITCVYSPQKQMGRPKKRQRTEEGNGNSEQERAGNVAIAGQSAGWDGIDMSGYGLGTSGSMEPWLIPDGADGDWDVGIQNLPGLTPDYGSGSSDSHCSPPILNLPPELQHTHTHHHRHKHLDTSTSLLLSTPTNNPNPVLGTSTSTPACACLSTLYLNLSTLSTLPPHCPFPYALHPLRSATQTASEVLACSTCPKSFISAVQNTQLVGTLLTSIAERFARVVQEIDKEAERAEREGETKQFRLADLNTSTSHLHTGGLGCAAAFSVDLSPREWRALAKKVVRAEIHGPSAGNSCCPFFLGVTKQMVERQERCHALGDEAMPADCPPGVSVGSRLPMSEHLCLKLVGFAESLVQSLDWS